MAKLKRARVNQRSSVLQNGVYQDVVVANPRDLNKKVTLKFLVDTGSSGTVIPGKVAKLLNLECVGDGVVELADGSRLNTKLAYLYLKIDSEHIFTLASYNGCKTALLGFDVMSVLGLQLDVARKRFLKPIRRVNLVSFILNKGWVGARRRLKRG